MAEKLYQRDVYGKTLVELGQKDKKVIVLDADLSGSTRTSFFAKEFPERFFNFGVAEQNMLATAAGLASCGKIVFASTFAMFAAGRGWDQVRNSISYGNHNVKIVATHAGVTVGPDGASHQALEDIAIMQVIPNMNVVVPCDGEQTKEAVLMAYETKGPFYIRLGRSKVPTVENKPKFELGKAQVFNQGKDFLIIACGIMVEHALLAIEELNKEGINPYLINVHTIRPLDKDSILNIARNVKGVVVCEEHSTVGGLAASVDEILSEHCPKKTLRIGVKHQFGQSGDPADLLKAYNLMPEDIVKAVKDIARS